MIDAIPKSSVQTSTKTSDPEPPAAMSELNNVVVSQASADLPVSSRMAYFAWSDFSRHQEWTPNIISVDYIDASRHEARWTMESYGLRFGWSTVPIRKEPTKLLVWKSVKGVRLEGRVEFEHVDENHCRILYTLCYVSPRKTLKHDLGPSMRESIYLKQTLENFGEIVRNEGRARIDTTKSSR